MTATFNEDLRVNGNLTVTGDNTPGDNTVTNAKVNTSAAIARSKLAQNTVQEYGIDPTMLRVWDDHASLLPGTASADDLAVIEGTFGTDFPTVQTSDAKTTTVTQRAAFIFTVPPEYDAAETFEIRVRAGMITTISDGTATVDIECFRSDGDGGVSSDLCATAAQSINSLTAADKDFTITATSMLPGDKLHCRCTIAITDSATGTAVIGEITDIAMRMDIRG